MKSTFLERGKLGRKIEPRDFKSEHSGLPWEIGLVFGQPGPILETNGVQCAQTAKNMLEAKQKADIYEAYESV